jgi:iron complex outermembrane receptor protein
MEYRRAIAVICMLSGLPLSAFAAAALEEIVVTAQKREQTLQDVSVAVTAFTGEDMHALKMTRPQDLGAQTPGLQVKSSFSEELPVFTVRGIGLNDFSPVVNPTTSVYVNEVLIPYHTMLGMQVFDIDRVEVLRGPQGTLYGRNNTGGAINFVTRKPTQEPEGYARVDYGSYRTVEIDAAAGRGLTKALAGRAAVQWKKRHKGYQRNRLEPGDSHGEIDHLAARFMLDWAPNEDVDVLMNVHGDIRDDDQAYYNHTSVLAFPFSFQPFCAPVLAGVHDEGTCVDFLGYFDPDDDFYTADLDKAVGDMTSKFTGWGAGITVEWRLPRFTVTSVTGYERMSRNSREDTDSSPLVSVEGLFNDDTWAVSQELRLTSDESWPVDWILGFYYSDDQVDGQLTVLMADNTATTVDHNYVQDTESFAGFARFGWPFAESFKLNGGIRVTHETKEMSQLLLDFNPFGISLFSQPASYCAALGICGIPGLGFEGFAPAPPMFTGPIPFIDIDGRQIDETDVSGEIGVDWTPNERWLLYAKFSKGFKSGGFNGGLPLFPADAEPFGSEEIFAWEGGFKTSLLAGTMRLNAAGFYYDYRDFQAVIGRPGGFFPIDNAGDAEVYGAEAEVVWVPIEGLRGSFGLAYLSTEVTETAAGLVQNIDGNDLANAPEWTFNGAVSYTVPLPWWGLKARAHTDFNWQDDMFFDVKNLAILTQDAYWLVNARLSLLSGDERWELALWGSNLADKTYFRERFDFTGFSGIALDSMGFPREVGVSLSYRFE